VSRIMMFAIIDKETVSSPVFTKRGSPGGSPSQTKRDDIYRFNISDEI
jgi:hypothetical protein